MLRNNKTKDRSGDSLLGNLSRLLDIMRADPRIADELPAVRRLATRALIWLAATEFFLVLQVYPLKFFIDELGSDTPHAGRLLMISLSFVLVY